MKNFGYYMMIAFTIVVDASLVVLFNVWCASLPHTTLLWLHGAVCAYIQATLLGLIAAGFCTLPALLCLNDLKED